MTLIDRAEARRKAALSAMDPSGQAALGQYFTPYQAALIIAGLPRLPESESVRILDPGAGIGILSAALVDRIRAERPNVAIDLVVVEVDETLHASLRETLLDIESLGNITTTLLAEDFLQWSIATDEQFDLVIQNPPYAKLPTKSAQQALLRDVGIEVPNIYAAFIALGLRMLTDRGQQVAITPRSWMNGTYYSSFRRQFTSIAGIDSIHTFESRSKVFGDTGVLQEAIVVSSTRGMWADDVKVYTSHDHRDEASVRIVAYQDVVTADFIHVPATQKDADAVAWMTRYAHHTLEDLGLKVSTGRVVDFRSRDRLHMERIEGAWPMVNASHIKQGRIHHPVGTKKPEWFHTSPEAASKLLVPAGAYVLIKRFSAKEERRRVSAAVWKSDDAVAFDNKLNYVHRDGGGLDVGIARGIAVFLNSTQIDDYFRVFSGHTQVNATDLRQMRFPSHEQLRALAAVDSHDQAAIDAAVEDVVTKIEVAA